MIGACLRNLLERRTRPASVGGLQAPTNKTRLRDTQAGSAPFGCCSEGAFLVLLDMARWVPYLSAAGRFISSQKTTSHGGVDNKEEEEEEEEVALFPPADTVLVLVWEDTG